MPTYEYMCKKCGPFTQLRAMAECELPSACPECGARAPRVLLTAPGCLTMSAEGRQANAKFERGFESKGSPRRFNRPVLPRLGTETAKPGVFRQDSHTPVPSPSFRVTETYSVPWSTYPAGDGSAAIFPSMSAKSRRVR